MWCDMSDILLAFSVKKLYFCFSFMWCYLDTNRIIPLVSTHSLISYFKTFMWQVKLLPHRQILTTPLSRGKYPFSLNEGFWWIHLLGLCEAERLLCCPHLSPRWQTEFVSLAQYITLETDTSILAEAWFFGFLYKTQLKSMWKFPLWEGCCSHTVQNAHQAFLLITVKCMLRIQTGGRCIFSVTS